MFKNTIWEQSNFLMIINQSNILKTRFTALLIPLAIFIFALSLWLVWLDKMPLSLFTARLPFAIVNVLLGLVLYRFGKQLFGKWFGVIVGIVAVVNPWMVYIGRISFDVPSAIYE